MSAFTLLNTQFNSIKMKNIVTIGELRQATQHLNNEDIVVVEIHEGERHEDLYTFYIDDSIQLDEERREIRICI